MDGVTIHERLAGHPGVAQVMLDRAEALNAIDTAMAYRLAQAFAELAADRQVHAIVLCAAGERAFFGGADPQERNRMSDADLLRPRPAFRAAVVGLLALPPAAVTSLHPVPLR